MKLIRKDKKKLEHMSLCDVPAGFIFKFDNIGTPMLKLSEECGYVELGGVWHSVEELDRENVRDNTESVKVYGKLSSIVV